VADHIRAHPDQYECFIASTMDGPEARAFLETHPAVQTVERRLGQATIYIVLTEPPTISERRSGALEPIHDRVAEQ
jgi:hypothetical protein